MLPANILNLLLRLLLAAVFVGLPIWLITRSFPALLIAGFGPAGVGFLLDGLNRRNQTETLKTLKAASQRLKKVLEPSNNTAENSPARHVDEEARSIHSLSMELERDIQGRMQQQSALEENWRLLQSALSSMGEGVIVVSGHGTVLFANTVARTLLGQSHADPAGHTLIELARATELQDFFDQTLASQSQMRREISLKRQKTILDIVGTRLEDSARTGCVLVMHDITERRELEDARREFVSNVSHELKSPLTAIQAYAETLLEGGLEDEDNNRRFVGHILEQSERLQELIQDMLRLARIESQQEAFDLERLDVGSVIQESCASREAVAAARNIQLHLVPGSTVCEVVADRSGLRTIVENLLSNAIAYSQPGGHVEVRWRNSEAEIVIEVQDTGVGIAAEHHSRIFERFYRVERARSRSGGGTGLGLAIVKHLTLEFGGRIELESEVGRGSLFRVILPAA